MLNTIASAVANQDLKVAKVLLIHSQPRQRPRHGEGERRQACIARNGHDCRRQACRPPQQHRDCKSRHCQLWRQEATHCTSSSVESIVAHRETRLAHDGMRDSNTGDTIWDSDMETALARGWAPDVLGQAYNPSLDEAVIEVVVHVGPQRHALAKHSQALAHPQART